MTNARFAFTRRRMLALGASVSACALLASPVAAQIRLDVTQGNVQPMPIALPDFMGSGGLPDPASPNLFHGPIVGAHQTDPLPT